MNTHLIPKTPACPSQPRKNSSVDTTTHCFDSIKQPSTTNSHHILIPLDVHRCPLDLFPLLGGLAGRVRVRFSLFHAVHLNVFPIEGRIHEELALEAREYLQRIAAEWLPTNVPTRISVRMGEPAQELLAEARSEHVHLIVLPTFGPSIWRRMKFALKPLAEAPVSPFVQQIIREAECGVMVTTVQHPFDCERSWRRPSRLKSSGSAHGARTADRRKSHPVRPLNSPSPLQPGFGLHFP